MDTSPDRDERLANRGLFCKTYAPDAPSGRPIRQLYRVLAKSQVPAGDGDATLAWLRRLAEWVLADHALEGANGRLAIVVRVLRENPVLCAVVAERVRQVLAGGKSTRLYASTGLPSKPGFLAEAGRRLTGHLLPEPLVDGNLALVLSRLFPGEQNAARLLALAPATVGELLAVLGDPLAPLQAGLDEALLVLAARIAALGLADDLLERASGTALLASPFLELPRRCEQLALAPAGGAREAGAHCQEGIEQCRSAVQAVRSQLETGGVSIDLVYRVELVGLELSRLELLARIRGMADDGTEGAEQGREPRLAAGLALVVALVRGASQERSLRSLTRRNMHLLARKVVEHSGETGDHYITSSRGEYWRMLGTAGGGGVLTAATTVGKFWGAAAKLPLLLEGMFSAVNYAGSFVLMQLVGFTLATKQPSATAAALARSLAAGEKDGDLAAWANTVARITRSQLAAAAGNLGLVVPAALGIEALLRWRGRGPLLDPELAAYVVGSLHPLKSPTIPFAVLTGVLLWLSSVVAGAVDNWSKYRRLPEAIGSRRWVRRLFGERGAAWMRGFLERHVAGFGGNVSLGVFLASVPILGKFVGLGLDVRHVTLSTGALTFAVSALGLETVNTWGFAAAVGGIGIIACLNFGVSFALAMWVALRAEGGGRGDAPALWRALFGKLRREPLDFLRPPREPAGDTAVAPVIEP